MRSVIIQQAPREVLIALPDCETDIYRVHQLVWNHVARAAKSRTTTPSFIYRIDGGMIRVRSYDLPGAIAPLPTPATEGHTNIRLDLAAVQGTNHDEPIAPERLEQWCTNKLAAAGFGVDAIAIEEYETRSGTKVECGRIHKIQIPVVRVRAKLKVVDIRSCETAWVRGIGRGKRFGLGMLAH